MVPLMACGNSDTEGQKPPFLLLHKDTNRPVIIQVVILLLARNKCI